MCEVVVLIIGARAEISSGRKLGPPLDTVLHKSFHLLNYIACGHKRTIMIYL